MKRHLPLRPSLLALTFGSAAVVLGKVALFPVVATDSTMAFTFPAQVPLPEWQFVGSQLLDGKDSGDSRHMSGKRYRYRQGNKPLEIDMHYFTRTNGDVAAFLKTQITSTTWSKQQQRQSPGGYYRLLVNQEKAYLSACINPYGGSTVTAIQFKQNRNTYDISQRFLPWLLGQGAIQDPRCLWVTMSVPLNQSAPDTAYENLEGAWSSWCQWWQQHFPHA